MKFGPELVINHVLYVPDLMCNLISISQLLHFNPKYGVEFIFIKIYVLYRTIGTWRVQPFTGLSKSHIYYFFKFIALTFGTLSTYVMKQFPGFSNNFHSSLHDCFICFQAKQTRHPFSLSNTYSSNIFDLVHCDV